jgi:hypothetical protein
MTGKGIREIDSVEERLEDIIKNHQNRILEINKDTKKLIHDLSSDKNTNFKIDFTIPFLQKIEGLFKLDRSITQRLNGDQMLKMAAMEYAQAIHVMDRLSQDHGHSVLIESIHRQLDLLYEELKQVSEAINQVKNKNDREILEKRKKEVKRELKADDD